MRPPKHKTESIKTPCTHSNTRRPRNNRISSDPTRCPSTTELTFRMCIQQALQSLFGLAGAAIIVDVLDWNEKTNVGFIRVNQSELVTVWNALMLHQFRISDMPCIVEVLGSSASLLSLADDSRR
ncbi:hypothetical protein BX666DRAFT_1929345 [Dichotomocladium elegans]|nr:hypothetical protein BX666DRAFT_1929345 [Dichotomocladium elegans]